MTVSALATGSIKHHNKYNSRDGTAITRVIPHHWAGTSGGDVTLADPKREASANYLIYSDGTIKYQVPEEYRAWTTGSWEVDASSITVEIQNSTNGPEWRVSDKAIAALVNLIADIARRYKWGSVPSWRVRGHREFVATACPGPYMFPKLAEIAAAADTLARSGDSPKGDTVIHYHKPYRKTRNIKPKERLYLVNAKGAKENVVGGVGPYTLTAHLYGDGFAPGDILELRYDWYDTKTKKTSPHYLHRVEADKHGMIRENATFQRAVPAGSAVYLSVYAGQANKKTGTVFVLDSDAYLHTA